MLQSVKCRKCNTKWKRNPANPGNCLFCGRQLFALIEGDLGNGELERREFLYTQQSLLESS